tara:strand:- start:3273 stop:3710 length:438 start_codon:yes stop_codon:yes gene_type:complete
MENNNNKMEILKNLQKTLNLLNKVDLRGGNKLTPDELKKRIDIYMETKIQILSKIQLIYEKLGVINKEYDKLKKEKEEYAEQWRVNYDGWKNEKNEVNKVLEENKSLKMNIDTYSKKLDNMKEVEENINSIGNLIAKLGKTINSS